MSAASFRDKLKGSQRWENWRMPVAISAAIFMGFLINAWGPSAIAAVKSASSCVTGVQSAYAK